MCKIASKLSMNLELYKNLGYCFSRKLKCSDYEYFSFAFFQAPRRRQVAASAVAGPLQLQRTRVQTSAASRCRLLLVFCLFCFFRGVCMFLQHSSSSFLFFLFLGNTRAETRSDKPLASPSQAR